MIISNRIAERPPIAVKSLELGFASFIAVVNPTRMLDITPSHPTSSGMIPEVTKTIEKESVPIDQQIMAILNLLSLVLNMVRA